MRRSYSDDLRVRVRNGTVVANHRSEGQSAYEENKDVLERRHLSSRPFAENPGYEDKEVITKYSSNSSVHDLQHMTRIQAGLATRSLSEWRGA